ncbi:hypothetical protein [Mesorhizobium sp.]|uniref:hypothetical protein n=1 Tax=Mesorhizobium sp. TaxID=1871066 RepID=UPI000FE768A3|nr:hypothetical protein [Mesorhizobium sp.]RWM47991.1 MAG: hypothetical protein EOR79_33070 [Mesorhizobium sp.]
MTGMLSKAVKLPFELNPAHELSNNVGLIVLASDEVGAQAFTKIIGDYDLRLFVTRARYSDESNNFELVGGFENVAQTLPPPGSLDVLAFNCTPPRRN